MGKLIVVVGGQFGSEGKGAVAAFLARKEWKPLLAIRVAGPNAGHTAYDDEGREFKLQQVPVAAVVKQHYPNQIALAIAAGSEIDMETLDRERANLAFHGHDVYDRLFIDSQATMITHEHVVRERGGTSLGIGADETQVALPHGEGGLTKRIGSTGKGIGAARADRIMRTAQLWDGEQRNVAEMAMAHLERGHTVMIEGTQGYGLGLHAGWYPYCTSSDCRAIDFMAMAGISPWHQHVGPVEIWVCLRTHPIRVAGESGPLFGETTWAAIGQEPEYTTVTKKVRRVGSWDLGLARQAIRANGGGEFNGRVKVALMFYDYWKPELKDRSGRYPITAELRQLENDLGAPIELLGTGPQTLMEVDD